MSKPSFDENTARRKTLWLTIALGRATLVRCSPWTWREVDVFGLAELQALLTQLPLWPFLECEIIPMLSTEEARESAKRAQAAIQS